MTVEAATGTVEAAVALAERLVDAWGSWGPTLSPDCTRMAFLSDRSGSPQIWVQPLDALIAYKELIGRSADVAELQVLTPAGD